MKTHFDTTEKALADRGWVVLDAADQVVGRFASKVASILRGKHKPSFAPHIDCGDFVVVVNADKIRFTGRKREQKAYYRHTGYVGGLKSTSADELLGNKPEEVIRLAVKRMLPRTSLALKQIKKLKIYRGAEHPHQAQVLAATK